MENVKRLRQLISAGNSDFKAISQRLQLFDKLCESASLQALSKLTEDDALKLMGAWEHAGNSAVSSKPADNMVYRFTSYLNPFNMVVNVVNLIHRISPFAVTKAVSPASFRSGSVIASSYPDLTEPSLSPISPSSDDSTFKATASVDSSIFNKTFEVISSTKDSAYLSASYYYNNPYNALPFKFPSKITYSDILPNEIRAQAYTKLSAAKSASENIISSSLDQLPPSVNGSIRSLLKFSPLELKPPRGRLFVCGAGPGDPELLTLRALNVLATCHVVFADQILPPGLIKKLKSYTSSRTRIIIKSKSDPKLSSDAAILECLDKGNIVVKLKSGDPFIFGGSDDCSEFEKTRHEIIFVPGISSAFSTGTPLIKKYISDSIQVISGGSNSNLASLQPFNARSTVIVLAPVANFCKVVDRFISQGYPLSLPVALHEKSTWGTSQGGRAIKATLGEVLQIAIKSNINSPAVFIAGYATEFSL